MAAPWVFDNAILYAVDCVTGIEYCFLYCRQLGRRNKAGGSLIQRLCIPDGVGKKAGPGVGRRSGDDSIEIRRISLGLHKSFTAAVRTTEEVGKRLWLTIESMDQGFCLLGGFVYRAISKINELLWMAHCPNRAVSASVAVIGAGGDIASP